LGLYVHVPFCKGKCPYCDFHSVHAPERVPVFLENLGRESELWTGAMGPFDSLYIGGGTPSALSPQQLTGLLSSIRRQHNFKAETEVTVELNPADVDAGLLASLRQAGVNRLSLGVQSFDDDELRLLGRRHDGAGARRAIETIREAGFAALGMDLIHGLPGSDLRRWSKNLEQALGFHPEHLSCYALTVAPDTPFGRMQREGTLVIPDENTNAALFLETSRILAEAGYDHYEVSNFARNPKLRSRHNQKYWRRVAYLGLGPAAHSYDGRKRWWNLRDLGAYDRALSAGRRPVEDFEEIDPEQARLEELSLGMRTSDGVDLWTVASYLRGLHGGRRNCRLALLNSV
jgi:oxygen-independent coproporphyrinogen-3 oxidase